MASHTDQNIVLIGFPGVGKSSIGKLVAERLNLEFIDTDSLIEHREARPITKIFRESGEPYFRQVEKQVIREISLKSRCVISTGGGCVLDQENIANLRTNSVLVYLSATQEALFERLQHDQDRPLLLGKSRWELADKLKDLMKRRAFHYIQTPNIIDVTCLSIDAIVAKIVGIYTDEITIKLVGLVGSNLKKSLSPLMHNAGFHFQNLNFHYQCFETEDLGALVERVKELGIVGFNVTFPYKTAIVSYLDELESTAEAIGAVNTVVNTEGCLIGYNTDVQGALDYLTKTISQERPGYQLAGRTAVVLGTGGAARALTFGLKTLDCNVHVLGRSMEKAQQIGDRFEVGFGALSDLQSLNPDLIVNASTLGMGDTIGESLVPKNLLKPDHIIFDLVYYPIRTKLLEDAQAVGAVTVDGVGMLVRQGGYSYTLWTGRKAPLLLMERVTRKFLETYKEEAPSWRRD